MKAFVNPFLLIICILLLVFTSWPPGATNTFLEGWVLLICLVAVVVNGALGLARALSHRPSLMSIGWAVVFLLFGASIWAMNQNGAETLFSAEQASLRQRVEAWRQGDNPFAPDEHGDSVLTLAAGLGRQDILAELLADASVAVTHADSLVQAAHRAAEHNREPALRQLLAAGVPVDARREGMTLLHTATLNHARRAAGYLLGQGAPVNAGDSDGATPLHHAVLAEDVEMVRLLIQHGANPGLPDADGRDAASYARTEALMNALMSSSVQGEE